MRVSVRKEEKLGDVKNIRNGIKILNIKKKNINNELNQHLRNRESEAASDRIESLAVLSEHRFFALPLPLIIHFAFVPQWLSSDSSSPLRSLQLPARTLGNIREYYTQELTLQITSLEFGPAQTPPSLRQDNTGSSAGYMPLIIKKARGGAGREEKK